MTKNGSILVSKVTHSAHCEFQWEEGAMLEAVGIVNKELSRDLLCSNHRNEIYTAISSTLPFSAFFIYEYSGKLYKSPYHINRPDKFK